MILKGARSQDTPMQRLVSLAVRSRRHTPVKKLTVTMCTSPAFIGKVMQCSRGKNICTLVVNYNMCMPYPHTHVTLIYYIIRHEVL